MVEYQMRHGVPQCTLDNFERDFGDRHLLHGIVAKWAKERPDGLAIINANTGRKVSWKELDQTTTALALKLSAWSRQRGTRSSARHRTRTSGSWARP